jgi:drug/metabolite transporter (DMT)-like permease
MARGARSAWRSRAGAISDAVRPSPADIRTERIAAAAPYLFVLFWSSGFVAAKGGLSGAEPLTFLALRFALVTVIMLALALAFRAPWPRTGRELGRLAITGLLMQALYFSTTYEAFAAGISAAALALILGLQPLITACVAGPLLGERVGARQWLGFALGILGVALLLSERLLQGPGHAGGFVWGFLALGAITAATLYQKRIGDSFDIWSGGIVQYGVSAVVVGVAALALEDNRIGWSLPFGLSLAYLVLMNSIVAIGLLTLMIRRGEASRVTALFFLVPPAAALIAWLVLGERLGLLPLLGMAVAAAGVALVMRR